MAVIVPRTLEYNPDDLFSLDSSVRKDIRSVINKFYNDLNFDFASEIKELSKLAINKQNEKCNEEALKQYFGRNKGLIFFAISEAKRGFSLHESLDFVRPLEKAGHKEMSELISLGEKFYKKIPKIDFQEMPNPRSPNEYLYHWLADGKDYGQEIERWNKSVETIEAILSDLRGIKSSMRKRAKGSPNKLNGLSVFVLEMALMYQDIYRKDFKVNKLHACAGGKKEPLNDAMIFLFKAHNIFLNVLKVSYTPENIYNASERVRKFLGSISD